jgi:hypothetical protein
MYILPEMYSQSSKRKDKTLEILSIERIEDSNEKNSGNNSIMGIELWISQEQAVSNSFFGSILET